MTMTKFEIIENIRKMNLIDKDEVPGYLGYECYKDDLTGRLFEIDFDGNNEIVHIFEIDNDFEIVDILF